MWDGQTSSNFVKCICFCPLKNRNLEINTSRRQKYISYIKWINHWALLTDFFPLLPINFKSSMSILCRPHLPFSFLKHIFCCCVSRLHICVSETSQSLRIIAVSLTPTVLMMNSIIRAIIFYLSSPSQLHLSVQWWQHHRSLPLPHSPHLEAHWTACWGCFSQTSADRGFKHPPRETVQPVRSQWLDRWVMRTNQSTFILYRT